MSSPSDPLVAAGSGSGSGSPIIGIAILGAGIFAREAHTPAILTLLSAPSARVRLVAIHSRSIESCQALAALYSNINNIQIYTGDDGLHTLLARTDIHAVLIVMPISLQASCVRLALAAGKHVLSEKPVDIDVKHAIPLVHEYHQTWANKGLIWGVAENYRFIPVFSTAAQLVSSGAIGTPRLAQMTVHRTMTRDNKYAKTVWRQQPEHIGGFLSDGGVHMIAALRMVVNSDVQLHSITGNANQLEVTSFGLDTLTGSYLFSNLAHGALYLTFAAPLAAGAKLQLNVVGTEGTITVDGHKQGFTLTHTTWKAPAPQATSTSASTSTTSRTTATATLTIPSSPSSAPVPHVVEFPVENGVIQEWTAFLDSIANGCVDPRLDPRQALIDLECIERPIAHSLATCTLNVPVRVVAN